MVELASEVMTQKGLSMTTQVEDTAEWLDDGWLIELQADDGLHLARASRPLCESDTGVVNDVVNAYGSTPAIALRRLVEILRFEKV